MVLMVKVRLVFLRQLATLPQLVLRSIHLHLKDRSSGIADLQKAVKLLQQAGKQEEAQRANRFLKQWQLETKRTGTI